MIHDNVFIGETVKIGSGCKIQQYAYIPDGVIIGNDVFVGPCVCFTNDKYPPSNGRWKNEKPTVVCDGAVIGANSTILSGVTVGANALIGAGAVVTKNVPAGMMAYGNPSKVVGKRKDVNT